MFLKRKAILVLLSFVLLLSLIYFYNFTRSFEVVVARYNEDLDWINHEFPDASVIVYNKGKNDIIPQANWKIINLPNIGRESHTYLYHIVTNYNNLADRTLFIQGHPYDHEVYPSLNQYKTRMFNGLYSKCRNIIAPCGNALLYEFKSIFKKNTRTNVRELDYMSEHLAAHRHTEVYRHNVTYDTLKDFLYNVIGSKLPGDTTIGGVQGAIFAVNKNVILEHKKDYYQMLLAQLDKLYQEEGYYFEKLWDVIFDTDKYKDIENK